MSTITAMRESEADLKKRIAQALCPRVVTADGGSDSLEVVFNEICRMYDVDPTRDMWEQFEQDYKEWAQEVERDGAQPTPWDFLEHHLDYSEVGEEDPYEDKWEPRQVDQNNPYRPLSDQELLNYKANPITDRPDLHAFKWPEGKPLPPEIPVETRKQWVVWTGQKHSVLKLPPDPLAYQWDGIKMQHCLVFLNERYADAAKNGDIELYSMVDNKTFDPVVDIELAVKHGYGVQRSVEKPTVMQIRGYQNQCPPADEYMADLMAFLKSYGADWDTTHNMRNFDGKPDAQLTNQRWDEMQGTRTARLLTAATLEETIAGLQQAGVPADVVEFVKGQKDTSMQGRMVGELKKNPQATVDQLKAILQSAKPKREIPPHIFFGKMYPKLDPKTLHMILGADPSTPADPNANPPKKAVVVPWLKKFVPWLLQQATLNPEQFNDTKAWEDKAHAQTTAETIKKFFIMSNKPGFQGARDILQYKSFRELQDVVRSQTPLAVEGVEFVPRQKVSGKNLVAEYTPPTKPGNKPVTLKLWIVTTYKDARELSKHPTTRYNDNWCFVWEPTPDRNGPDHFNRYSGYGFIYIITKNNLPYAAVNAGNAIEMLGKECPTDRELEELEPLFSRLPKLTAPRHMSGYEAHIDRYSQSKYGRSWDDVKRERIPKGTNIWGYKEGGAKKPAEPAKPARAPRRGELRTAISKIDDLVIEAWKAGVAKNGSGGPGKPSIVQYETLNDYRLRTDGQNLYSYGHKIGETWPDGTKVAYDCKWSNTTKSHCWAAKAVSGYHRDTCPTCHPEAKEPDANNI